MRGLTSYHYWTLNPDQATSDVTNSPHPIIATKSIKRQTITGNGMKEVSIRTEIVAETLTEGGTLVRDNIV
jgi:hypothetical protein